MKLKKGMLLLASIFDQMFFKHWSKYDLQVETNNMAVRTFRAENSLDVTERADKVAEAFQAEGTVSSKGIKVMILNEARKELTKKKKLEKKEPSSSSATANSKTTKAKKQEGDQRRRHPAK